MCALCLYDALQVEFAPRPGMSQNHRVVYNDSTKWQLQAAWATTVHKAQGGEVPVVVMPLHQGMSRECYEHACIMSCGIMY